MWSPWKGKSRKHPSNVHQVSPRTHLVGAPDFTDRETEARGWGVTCPKLPGDFMVMPGLLALTPESMGIVPLTPEPIQSPSAPASGKTLEGGAGPESYISLLLAGCTQTRPGASVSLFVKRAGCASHGFLEGGEAGMCSSGKRSARPGFLLGVRSPPLQLSSGAEKPTRAINSTGGGEACGQSQEPQPWLRSPDAGLGSTRPFTGPQLGVWPSV